jgi:hypothetical protein
VWIKIETLSSQFFLATVYHPPNPEYNQIIEFLIDSCEGLLLTNPNSKLIIAGDVNQLDVKEITNHVSRLLKLVKSPTRGT